MTRGAQNQPDAIQPGLSSAETTQPAGGCREKWKCMKTDRNATMNESKKLTRYERAELIRQAAIDYLIANPGAKAPHIIAALGWHPVTGADRLSDMTDRGELARVATSHRAGRQMVKTYAYTALVTKTRSAAKTAKDVTENLKHPAERRPRVVVRELRDPNRMPIPNQGGQGAVRHEIRRGCSLS